MEEKHDHIEKKECTEYLSCVLSEKELIEKGKELAAANEELAQAENRKKDLMADITAQIKKHEANIGALSRIVSQGKEYRNVACEWEINYTKGTKVQTRLDTYEVIKNNLLEQCERQEKLIAA